MTYEKLSIVFGLFLSFSVWSSSTPPNVCTDITTFPEGGHKNYEIQLLSRQGQVFTPGSQIPVKIFQTFALEATAPPPLVRTVRYVSNSGNILLLKSDDGAISLQINRSVPYEGAPFYYPATVDVNIGSYVFSSQATPSMSDPSVTYALPYSAEMLNPEFPQDQQGSGQLTACSFR